MLALPSNKTFLGRDALKDILSIGIPFDLCTLYLEHARYDKYLFCVLITPCKSALTRHWLHPDSPTIDNWIDLVK